MSEPEPSEPSAPGPWWAVAFLMLVMQVVDHDHGRLRDGGFMWDLWADRDLTRAAELATTWPTSGAELSYGDGARVPGGLLYLLLAVPLSLTHDVGHVYRFQALLDTVGTLLLAVFVGRRWGPMAGAIGAAVVVSSGAHEEVMAHLWNPGLLPLPAVLAHLSLWRWVGDRDPLGLPALALSVALGAQLHLSVLLLAVAWLPGLVVTRPPVTWRAVALAVALVAFAYAPYLVSEVWGGAPNSAAMLRQGPVRHLVDPGAASTSMLVGLAELPLALTLGRYGQELFDAWAPLRLVGQLPLLFGAWAAVVAVRRFLRRRGTGEDRVLAVLVTGIVGVGLYYAWDRQIALNRFGHGRYVAMLAPGVAICVAAWTQLAGQARWRRAGWIALFVPLYLQVGFADRQSNGTNSATSVRQRIETLMEHTGLPLDDVVSRTVFYGKWDGARWSRDENVPVGWWLHEAGQDFPGSRVGSCLAVQVGAYPWAPPPETGGELRPGKWRSLTGSNLDRYAWYDVDGPCPTSFSQRYLDTPAEAAARPWWGRLGHGGAVTLPPPEGVQARRVVMLAPSLGEGWEPQRVMAVVDVARDAGVLVATLHSNQLRGLAYNTGWFMDAVVDRPRLVWTGSDGQEVVQAWAPGRVGRDHVITPLRSDVTLGPGRWTATLVVEVPRLGERSQGGTVGESLRVEVPLELSVDLR